MLADSQRLDGFKKGVGRLCGKKVPDTFFSRPYETSCQVQEPNNGLDGRLRRSVYQALRLIARSVAVVVRPNVILRIQSAERPACRFFTDGR